MSRPLPTRLVAATIGLSLTARASAWNGEAHQLVAWVAEARLSDNANAGVREVLGDSELSDAEVVSWADEVRRERKEESRPLHQLPPPRRVIPCMLQPPP